MRKLVMCIKATSVKNPSSLYAAIVMFLKMQQLACPSHFPLWLKIIFVLRSQGLLSCSVGAVIWQGSHLALLLLLSGPVVLLISCLHSSRAVSLPPEHGAFLEP